jgi:hypothetical protein
MGDVITVDDVALGLAQGGGPLPLSKVGSAMEGLGFWYHSKWYEAGFPGAGAAPSSGINGAALTSDPTMVNGQVPFVKPATGNTKRLGRFSATANRAGAALLFDRLWANSGLVVTTTTSQAITPAAAPSRDAKGLAEGNGVIAAIEVSTPTGNVGAISTATITYTNESGIGSKTGTIPSFPATAVAGTLIPFQLAAGDRGVRSIQAFNLGGTSLVSGAIHLLLLRHLATLPFTKDGGETVEKYWDQLGIVRLYDGSVPFLAWAPRDTTAVDITAADIQYIER